jgi:hypothetical protein
MKPKKVYILDGCKKMILGIIKRNFTKGVVQVFGEVVPVQGGYSYGQVKPTSRLLMLE